MSASGQSETATSLATKVTVPRIAEMKHAQKKIAMVTAYDTPSARLAAAADVDVILVGDSAGTTMLGLPSTVHVGLDEMLIFVTAVVRAASHSLIVADMPFGSYQCSNETAIASAVALTKAGADAVKLEGGGAMIDRAAAIVHAGIPVMGHLGLTPQSASMLGGCRAQARTAAAARQLQLDALALQHAGCFAIVLEAIPAPVAAYVTSALRVATIGIGAGAECDGQVLVWHDLLGLSGRVPRFVKQYADLKTAIVAALSEYVADVRQLRFPEERHTYAIPQAELQQLDLNVDVPLPAARMAPRERSMAAAVAQAGEA